jgi:small subunit ribosomal protein S17
MSTESKQPMHRKIRGVVVSDKMDKTVVVRVDRVRSNTKYHKQYMVSTRYKVHDEKNQAKIGDVVDFIECRPLSKTKRWRLVHGRS